MTASSAHRALGATITRLADHQRAEAVTRDTLPALRADWAASRAKLPRLTQQQVLDADMIRHTRRYNRIIIATAAVAIIIGLILGHAITSAWTASIAADLAR